MPRQAHLGRAAGSAAGLARRSAGDAATVRAYQGRADRAPMQQRRRILPMTETANDNPSGPLPDPEQVGTASACALNGRGPIRVWDLPTRLFHWLVVLLVAGAWATWRLNRMAWHERLGEALMALLLFRVAWGFVGSDTARFARFLATPAMAWRHLARVLRREPDAQAGHNPAG